MSNKKRNADKNRSCILFSRIMQKQQGHPCRRLSSKKANKPAPPKAEEKPVYDEKQQEEVAAKDVQKAEQSLRLNQ